MKIFTVYDKQSHTYSGPFVEQTEVHAMRAFKAEVNRHERGNMIAAYPNDFALYELGSFDPNTGELSTHTPSIVVEASACIIKGN